MSRLVPQVSPMSRAKIELQATQITQQFWPELLEQPGRFPVLDFFELLRDAYGLDPGVGQLSEGVEGITWPDGRVFVSEETYRGAAEGKGRPRFTIPHEGYHGIQHRRQIRNALVHTGQLVLHRRQAIPAYRDPEWQANTFASALLMPATMVQIVASQTDRWELGNVMQDVFGVSYRAAEVRLEKLAL